MSDNKTINYKVNSNCWVTSKTKNEQSTPKNTSVSSKSCDKSENGAKKINDKDLPECTICYLPISQPNEQIVLEECGHIFHSGCIRLWMKQKRTCPFCAGFSLLPEEYPPLM